MHWHSILFLTLVILAVSLFIKGSISLWRNYWGNNASLIKQRLCIITNDPSVHTQSLVKNRLLSDAPIINSWLRQIPHIGDLDAFLTQTGLSWNVAQFLMGIVLLCLASTLTASLMGMRVCASLVVGAAPLVCALLYVRHKHHERIFKIESQLPDALDLMARAMQAGHAFSSALLIVGAEGTQPIREEFQTTFSEINFGIPTETALHRLTLRVPSSDLRFFVVAVLIQLETGGNLTEILKSLAALIRDRQRIAGSVRVLTAEGRLSAWILGLLPFGIAVLLSVINPEFIDKLWTEPMGIRMLQVSLGLMAIGIWWMWRMTRIRI
jgi:tight adherence protein B